MLFRKSFIKGLVSAFLAFPVAASTGAVFPSSLTTTLCLKSSNAAASRVRLQTRGRLSSKKNRRDTGLGWSLSPGWSSRNVSHDYRKAEQIRQRTRNAGMKSRSSEEKINQPIACRLVEAGLEPHLLPRERDAAKCLQP